MKPATLASYRQLDKIKSIQWSLNAWKFIWEFYKIMENQLGNLQKHVKSSINSNQCVVVTFFIFLPYFILERKIFKSHGLLFTNFAKNQFYIQVEGCYRQNSTHINSASFDMYVQRLLDFFRNDKKDPIMTQNDTENNKKSKIFWFLTFLSNLCHIFDGHREKECSKHSTRQEFVVQ